MEAIRGGLNRGLSPQTKWRTWSTNLRPMPLQADSHCERRASCSLMFDLGRLALVPVDQK
jgi:hypothetical protein